MATARPSIPPLSREPIARVVLVTGKGGVGKTTVAAGLAVLEHRLRGRAALVEFGDGESGVRALGESRGLGNLEHVVIRPDEALERAVSPMLGGGIIAKVTLGNFAVKRVFQAAPAVRELAMLECVRMLAERDPKRRVIVDMPATGHGIAWLTVAARLRKEAEGGPLYDLCLRLERELVRPGRASPIVVALPERLVLRETLELCEAMRQEVGLPVARLVANRVPEPLPEHALASVEERAKALNPDVLELLGVLQERNRARSEAMDSLAEAALSGGALSPLVLPESPTDPPAELVSRWLEIAGVLQ